MNRSRSRPSAFRSGQPGANGVTRVRFYAPTPAHKSDPDSFEALSLLRGGAVLLIMTRNEIQTQIEAATYTLPETRDLGEVRIETSLLTPEAKRYLSERNRLDVERVLEQFGMAHA